MRFAALAASLVGSAVFALLIPFHSVFIALCALCALLSAIGIWDLVQSRHSIRRNYPILAHIRFGLEKIRPEIRQYFLESETDGTPSGPTKSPQNFRHCSSSTACARSARIGTGPNG